MSQQIDNQIVKMQFDNASFEKNAQQSMSTLEKLKQALKFDKVNMTPLQQAFAETEATATKAGFHIQDIWTKMGSIIEDQVAAKIVNTGKKIANALTLEGVNDGFKEYELKMGSIQTIMAGTGESLATVNHYLDELNTYSDKTIYSFADMTSNIGKFTNAGVKLKDAVAAIKGIANEAAVSGANANEASRAMYNFSQALSAGFVKLIDWKSIENANMATKEFKQTLIDVAQGVGTLVKRGDDWQSTTTNIQGKTSELFNATKGFNDSLNSQWMTTEVLTRALEIYSTDIRELTKDEKDYYEARLAEVGITGEQLEKYEQLGIKAADAATEIKTFTMLIDTLKEAIGSGWAMSWQYIIGDFEQAKALWTDVGNTVGDVINKMSDARNNFLKVGLQNGWEKTIAGGGLKTILPDAEKFRGILVDIAREQNILTKDQYTSIYDTNTMLESLHKDKWMTGDLLKEAVSEYSEVVKSLTDAEKEAMGFSDDDIKNLEDFNFRLQNSSALADEFAKSMNEFGGRENVIEGLKNVFESLMNVLGPIRQAFMDAFGVMNPTKLFELTKGFREFTEQLKVSPEAANTLYTTFKMAFGGIKTIFDGIITAVRGVTKLVLPLLNLFDAVFGLIGKVVSALTGSKGALDAADRLGKVGDKISTVYLAAMQKLANLINKVANAIRNIPESTVFVKIHDGVTRAVEALQAFWEAFTQMPIIQQMVTDFNNTIDAIGRKITPVIDSVKKSMDDLGKSVQSKMNLQTLNSGLTVVYTKIKAFVTIIKDFAERIKLFFTNLKEGKSIVESFRTSFGDIVDKVKALKKNLTDFFDSLFSKGDEINDKFDLKAIQQAIHDFVTNITPDQVTMLAVATAFGLIALNMLRLSDAMRNAVEAFTGVGVALKNVINSYVKKQKSTILQIAEAIVIVAASLWVLSTIPQADLEKAVGALITIGAVLAGLVGVLTLAGIALKNLGGGKSLVELAGGLVIASGAFMVAVLALKALEYVKLDKIAGKIVALSVIMLGLVGLSTLMGKIDKFSKGSITMLAVAGALLMCSTALAKIGEIPAAKMQKSLDAVLKMMFALAAITFAAGNVGVFSAVGLIAIVMTMSKILPMIEDMVNYDYTKIQTGLKKNEEVVKKLGMVVGAMVILGAIAGNRLKGAGIAMLSLSATFAALLGIAKLASMMKPSELAQGEKFMWHMTAMFAVLELLSSKSRLGMFGGKNGGEGTKAFTRIAVAMSILLGVGKLASMMTWGDLGKAMVALTGLTGIVLAMVEVSKHAVKAEGTIKSVSGVLFAVSLILGEMAVIAMIPMKNMGPALGAILGIITAMSVLALAIAQNAKVYNNAKINIISMIPIITSMVAIVAMGWILTQLAKQPMENIGAAATALISVIGAMALMSKALSSVTGGGNFSQIQVVVETALMVYFVYYMLSQITTYMKNENIDAKTMLSAAGAIAIIMVGITPALLALDNVHQKDWKSLAGNVLGAIALLASVATAIGLLSNLGNPSTMINSALSISMGLIAICAPIAVIAAVGQLCNNVQLGAVWNTVLAAIVILGSVATAIGFLSNLGNPSTMIQSAQAISMTLLAISVPIAVMAAVGQLCKTANPGVMWSAVGGAVLALAGVAGVLYLFSNNIDVASLVALNDAIPILTTCLLGVAGLAVAISTAGLIAGGNAAIVGAGFLAINAALISLAEVILAVALLGRVISENPVFGWHILDGLDLLIQIAGKVGEAIGAFVNGFAVGVTSRLEEVADNLNKFAEKLVPFSENMSKVSDEAVKGAKNIAAAMLYLTAAEFLEGIAKFLKLGNTRSIDFAPLGVAIAGFCDAIKDIPDESVKKANLCSLIAERLAKIAKNFEFKGGVVGWFFGEKESLSKFGANLRLFGSAIAGFIEAIKDLPEDAKELVQRAADAATPMVEFSKTLLSDGGLVQQIIGHKNLGKFGENLTEFAGGLVGFIANLVAIETITPDYAAKIRTCAEATQPMVDLAMGIENSGGVLSRWMGEDTLDVFGKTLKPFAEGLKDFVKIIAKMAKDTPDYKQLIIDTAEAATHLVTLANNLEPMSGPLKRIFKDDTLAGFGKTLRDFGEGLASYAKSLVEVDLDLIANANAAVTELVQLGALASGVRADSFSGLKLALEQIAEIPVTMIANEIAVGTPLLHTNLVTMFDDILLLLQTRMVLDGVTYRLYGRELVWSIGQGILRNMHLIYVALSTMVTNIKTYLDGAMSQDKFYMYGANVAIGVANGIRDHTGEAVAAATALAAAVGAAIPDVLKIASPSKLTYADGKFLDLGLANGIRDYTSVAVGAASNMSEQVIEAANNVVTEIAKVLDADMDTQPVIRPVLDMSDVAAKAGRIGSMFTSKDLKLAYGISGTMKSIAPANATVITNAQNKAGSSVGNTINFTQNNYSPKELSRVEIYRQTQNQLSMMKGVVKANV